MAVWTTPITDRTANDVAYAKANQNESADLKGAWNISDANRVINNTIYLRDLLNQYGYTVEFDDQPLLTEADFPYRDSVIKVMKDNINAVVNAFYEFNNPTIMYGTTASYTGANTMEINLDITNTLLENLISNLLYCGEPYSGDTITL